MKIRKKLTAVLLMTSMVLSLGANGIFRPTIVNADMYSEYDVEYWDGTIETYEIGDGGGRILGIGEEVIDTPGVYEVINSGEGRITVKANTTGVVLILNNASRKTTAGIESTTSTSPLQIENGAEVTIVLLSGTKNEFTCNGTNTGRNARQSGIWLAETAKLTIKSEAGDNRGELIAESGYYSAGIGGGPNWDNGTIIIEGGKITATARLKGPIGTGNGAGIGGGGGLTSRGGKGGTIKIYGDAVVMATSSGRGAGIGGAGGGPNTLESGFSSGGGAGEIIEIYGNAKVTAISAGGGAGIGGGGSSANKSNGGSGGDIKIYGNAVVEASSSDSGAGIGGGRSFEAGQKAGDGGNIEIYGDAKVTAISDSGAGIGGGGSSVSGAIGGAGGNIEIYGNAKVAATSGSGAGIGGGGGNVIGAIGGDGGNIKIYGNPIVAVDSTETDSKCMGPGVGSNGTPGTEGTITITSGNVYARYVAKVTNKSDGTGDMLVMVEVKNDESNKEFSYEIESTVVGTYIYTATAMGTDNVYIWVPSVFRLLNGIEVERDTDDEIYNDADEVEINIYAEHGHITGEVVGMKWVRIPISANVATVDESEFGAMVLAADAENTGNLDSFFTYANTVNVSLNADKNARYWFKIDFKDGVEEVSEYVYIDIDNFYTPIEVYVQDIDSEDNDAVIKEYVKLKMPSDKPYGIPYDLNGSVLDIPSLIAKLEYMPNSDRPLSHWDIGLPEEPFDVATLTIALDNDVLLETGADKVEGNKYYYTAKYNRNTNWGEVTANFVDATGKAIRINGVYTDTFLVPLDGAGLLEATDFLNNGGTYAPPKNDQNKDAQGWYISGSSHSVDISSAGTDPTIYYRETNFQNFDPDLEFMTDTKTLEDSKKLFIVYPNVEETTSGGGGGGTVGVIKPTVPKEETVEPQLPNVSDKIKDILETENHISYIKGYPDATVKPNNNITRAEVATIFWRLIISSDKNNVVSSTFSDVNEDEWYAQAVNYLASLKIITGYEDGTFKPNQGITRAEFVAIASRFDDLELGVSNPFVDVHGSHWAYAYILSAHEKGWVSGYEGAVFLPDNKVTRAEVVKIVNGMLSRGIEKEDISKELHTLYSDLTVNHWAFAEIIEASVEHDYERKNNGYEIHTNR